MKNAFLALLLFFCLSSPLGAAQSTIVDVDGKACMGDDKSRKQTEQAAMADAKRNAAERAVTYLRSETQVKDLSVEKDLIEAYTNAIVKVIQEMEKAWLKDAAAGECFRTKIRAEVVPDEKSMNKAAQAQDFADNPAAPLKVKLWTDKHEYKQGEKIRIYLKGNKPFHARILYKDTTGNIIQLLPNPYRSDTYFNGGIIYEIPSGNDRFDLEVSPPFGQENISIYASTAPLGDLKLADRGAVYRVMTKAADVSRVTRGLKIKEQASDRKDLPSEFTEETLSIRTVLKQ